MTTTKASGTNKYHSQSPPRNRTHDKAVARRHPKRKEDGKIEKLNRYVVADGIVCYVTRAVAEAVEIDVMRPRDREYLDYLAQCRRHERHLLATAKRTQDWSWYSDLHKDLYGVRP